ncbi:MAG: putative lipid II flippase FtsW [Firmicutes bacterium]|nr:putative lipid II flippase FtsW [Bacillota bacterium]
MRSEKTQKRFDKAKNKTLVQFNKSRIRTSEAVRSGDFWITALVLGLVTFGVIMVFSASYYYAINKGYSPYHYLIRGTAWAVIGTMSMLFMASFDYHRFKGRFSTFILIVGIILLLLVFTPLGVTLNHATRWLNLGIATIMPGEWAKPACIVFVAAFLGKDPRLIHNFSKGILPVVGVMGVCAGLIMLQPNTSTAATLCMIICGMLFVAGIRWRYIIGVAVAAAGAFAYFILSDEGGYRMARVTSFRDPFADAMGGGYQVVQGLLAMGSGGLFGKGLGKSMQKTLYLPEPQNDFILAIIGEELGYIGLMLLLIAYLLLIWRCVKVSMNAPDMLGTLLASGVTLMISLQVILNIMVVTSMMPPTGVILPFVSWGGNALIIFMGCMGIVLNVSRHSTK